MQEKDLPILARHSSNPTRRHLLMAGFVVLLTMIFDKELLAFYLIFGVIGVLAITVLASFTNARSRALVYTDAVISGFMFVVFEYFALIAYSNLGTVVDRVFILRQIVALLFLGTLYVTLRLIRENKIIDEMNSAS